MSNEIIEIDEELKKSLQLTAKQEVSLEKSDIKFISIKGSKFSLGDDKLGKTLSAVILASAYDNAYYDAPYDPEVIRPPACFAIAVDSNDMVPHETSPAKQSSDCKSCPQNQFGSSGKGKACKNGRRLLLASADNTGVDFDNTVSLRIPPTSLKNFSSYVRRVAASGLPIFSVVTTIQFDENEDYPKLMFSVDNALTTDNINHIIQNRGRYVNQVMVPYDVSSYEAPGQVSNKLAG